jgi:hypothetical protein
MKMLIEIDFWFDGIEDCSKEEIHRALGTVLESGAESTCTEVNIESILENKVVVDDSEYVSLCEDAEFLSCLDACGVDNWGGYGEARQMMREEEDE